MKFDFGLAVPKLHIRPARAGGYRRLINILKLMDVFLFIFLYSLLRQRAKDRYYNFSMKTVYYSWKNSSKWLTFPAVTVVFPLKFTSSRVEHMMGVRQRSLRGILDWDFGSAKPRAKGVDFFSTLLGGGEVVSGLWTLKGSCLGSQVSANSVTRYYRNNTISLQCVYAVGALV